MKKYQRQYILKTQQIDFFMSPLTEEEIGLCIGSFNPKKAIRKLNIETKYIKFGEVLIISDTQSKFFNKFIEEGIYSR